MSRMQQRGGGDELQHPPSGDSPLSPQRKATTKRSSASHKTQQRPLQQFQVTKLRSWRTGYVRLLVLYEHEFATLDPTSSSGDAAGGVLELKETNRWPYAAVTEWLAVPNEVDTILLQVEQDKLKFSCHGVSRSTVLTAVLRQQDAAGHAVNPQRLPLFAAQRWKRTGLACPVLLHVLPYGLAELHADTRQRLQTYLYQDICAVSFPSSPAVAAQGGDAAATTTAQQQGIFLHFTQMGKMLLYTVADSNNSKSGGGGVVGSGRTALLKAMQEHYTVLGLDPLPMAPSLTAITWLERRRQLHTGPTAMQWNVTKRSKRHDSSVVGSSSSPMMGVDASPGGIVSRQLAVTGEAYLVERDAVGIVSVRRLQDLCAIIRDPVQAAFTLEFTNGSSTSYWVSHHRDAVIVSILDAAMQLGQNSTVHITDIPSAGYCLASSSLSSTVHESKVAIIFQPTPVPLYTLKRVYVVATHVFALVSGEFGLPQQSAAHRQEQDEFCRNLANTAECRALVEACREFNASVQHAATELTPSSSSAEKYIVGTMGALFGLISKLLQKDGGSLQSNSHSRQAKERVASTLFQTLYRLAKTVTGYKCSADLTTLRECLPSIWGIEDTFCKFGAYSVLNALVSGTNKDNPSVKRDMEAEYVNKNVLLKSGGQAMINGLVSSLLPEGFDAIGAPQKQVSDLILMVTSDILQSLLCSYHDTTSPEHFQAIIGALAHRYRALLSTLRSPTPFVIENTALLLHLLSTHAPSSTAAIRDAALSSAILLQHFYAATFSPLEGQRFLSRYLCSLWLSGPMKCDEKRLLKRMVPHGFLAYLNMPALSRMEEEQLDELERDAVEGNITDQGAAAEAALAAQSNDNPISIIQQREAATAAGGTNTARLRSRMALASATAANLGQPIQKENFRIFFHVLTQNHSLADLIWSQQTRRELRIALESELEYIRRETEARGIDAIAWNHQQFHVKYPSLDNEVKVGDVYMRLWLQAGDGFIRSWDEPVRLFEHLFRRFLCEVDRDAKVTVMCIRCLERLYAIHAASIGPFTDVLILVRSMASTRSVETQHRLLGLLATVLGVSGDDQDARFNVADIPENAEQLLNIDSISQLCQFVAWGHTNGDQVGNLLSRVLSVGMNGRAMLTDGSDAGPEGTDGTSAAVAGDIACPPVWFIASTGRIPPPLESIRGPFRVSDLLKMMEEGDLTPYDLVTTSHVEEYDTDIESTSETVREAQVDTGKWKRLNQVWQLRWQLCTDGTTSVIYSPSDVALLALRALTRLVDLHRSLDSRGVPYFPIPTAKRILCGSSREPNFTSESDDSVTNPLPIVCQSLLCNDGRIVEQSAELIYKLCLHNERAVSKLYLTGVFFFAFCYTGSDFKTLARLIHATHLEQHFKSGFAAAADESELPMKDRSILGHMLPEGLLFLLTNYGVDRFAEVFVSNADTPEAIWTFDMRKHLIEMIRQHLGDFPLRLVQNNSTEYEYCPMPGVAYKRLGKEIFCHNYYLHNLCDEVRFPEWPISQPVEVFRACLERFKKQLGRDGSLEEVLLEKARTVLDLKVGDESKELRKAYRSLARKFHPDKNPAGREAFEAIQTSYEVLLPLVERGEKIRVFVEGSALVDDGGAPDHTDGVFPLGNVQMQDMHLLIKTQLLICRRYETDMARLKYPAYSILLKCINLPASSKDDESSILESAFAKSERAIFVQLTVELIFRTCLISPLNSEELVTENGVAALASLLDFFVNVALTLKESQMDSDARAAAKLASDETVAGIIAYSVRTLSGVAYFEIGRNTMKALPNRSGFFVNWRRCLDGSLFTVRDGQLLDASMKRYALEGVANIAKEPTLQDELIGCGVVWPLLKLALQFDPTLEQTSSDTTDQDDIGISVASINIAARLAIRALGVLSGLYGDGPRNTPLVESLDVLLTSPISRSLRNKRTSAILRVLNTNVERADIIWNVQMRQQLEALLSKLEKERPEATCRSAVDELDAIGYFCYNALKEEVRIGGIYVRFFNKGGREALAHVENPDGFFAAIVKFVARSLNRGEHSEGWIDIPVEEDSTSTCSNETVSSSSLTSTDFLLGMNALRILCRVDGLVDDALCQTPTVVPSVLLSLLELPLQSEAFDIGGDILYSLSPRQSFADAVTKENAFWRLIQLLERPEPNEDTIEGADRSNSTNSSHVVLQRKSRGWSVLEALSSSPSIATCILSTTGWIELLGVLVGYVEFTKLWTARMGAAKTLSRLLWDPKTGSLADSLLRRFLPMTLTVRLKEDPEAMLKSFDGNSDTPELIWEASMRGELRKVLGSQLELVLQKRREEAGVSRDFTLEADVFVRYSKLEDELYIGGVYVSRFLKEPTYNLRDPTAFLELLLQRWGKELEVYTSEQGPEAKVSTTSAIAAAGQDILELVTTAIVYLCKVRDSLCEKLASWGYMPTSVAFLEQVLEKNLEGTPLLSVIRILHVASGRLTNVEALALVGHSNGRQGVIEFTIKSIGFDSLHPDSAFMIEFLKKAYHVALGDLTKSRVQGYTSQNLQHSSFVAMGPSPAPGEGPVRKRVSVGDDPLGMMQAAPQQTNSVQSPPAQLYPTPMSQGSGVMPYYQYGGQGQQYISHPSPSPQPAPIAYVDRGNQAHVREPQHRVSYQQRSQMAQQTPQAVSYSYGGQTQATSTPMHQTQNSTAAVSAHQGYQQQYSYPLAQNSAQGQQTHSTSQRGQYQLQQQQQQYSMQQPLGAHSNVSAAEGRQAYGPANSYNQQQQTPQGYQLGLAQATQASAQSAHYMSQGPQTGIRQVGSNPPAQQGAQQYILPQQRSDGRPAQNVPGQPPNAGSEGPTYPPHQYPHHPQQQYPHPTQQQGMPPYGSQVLQQNPFPSDQVFQQQQRAHDGSSMLTPTEQATRGQTFSQLGSNPMPPNEYQQGQHYPSGQPSGNESASYVTSHHHQQQLQQQQQQQSMGQAATHGQIGALIHTSVQPPSSQPNPGIMDSSLAQGGFPMSNVPMVETVLEAAPHPVTQYGPTPIEGSGIDVRTAVDPKLAAEQQAQTSTGAPGAAQGRVALLQQALACKLCDFLVDDVLENPALQKIRDPAAAKVHAIDLLKMLSRDPGYGPKFKMILDDLPAWTKYKSQDHSLLITGHEQKADYFLTDGGSGKETKLLTDK